MTEIKQMQVDQGEKLKLPIYREGASEWVTWWSQFKTMIHESPKFSVRMKHTKLREFTEGKAHAICKQFMFTDENYQKAVDQLKLKFGNKETIARELIRDLRKCPNVRKGNADDYRALCNQTNLAINYIDEYVPNELAHHKLLLGDIKQKLPPEDGTLFTQYWIDTLAKCETEEAKTEKENEVIKVFGDWLDKRTTTMETHIRMNQGFKTLDEPPSRNSPGKSPSKSYRGRYGGKPYSGRNLKEDFNYLVSNPVSSKTQPNPPQRGNRNSSNVRGTGKGRGGRGGATNNRGRGKTTNSKNLLKQLPSSTTVSPFPNLIQQTSKILPQVQIPKATVFPNDYRNNKCIICGDTNHKSIQCPLTSQMKAETLFRIYCEAQVCTNCLAYGHAAAHCNQKPACTMCKSPHTTGIHQLFEKIKFANKPKKTGNT